MTEKQNQYVGTGVRGRVVSRTIENMKVKQPELSDRFLEELRELLAAGTVPKADSYLQLSDKQIGGES
ncbi:MAG: hypothetical protein M5R41_07105 [Bacteroidia bacterium]|nr:hypothetical protein [Bacteroidia bacterium]